MHVRSSTNPHLSLSLFSALGKMGAAGIALRAPRRLSSSVLLLLLCLHLLCCCCGQVKADASQTLRPEEVQVLKRINDKLKVGWNFSFSPCSGGGGWFVDTGIPGIIRNLTCGECNTTTDGTNLCRVVSILLKGQNLTGELPRDFADLKSLKELDLTYNYFNGTFPIAWTSLPLVNCSVLGNRLTGRLPDEIGNITTLESLDMRDNLFEGVLPRSLGKLINLKRLIISSNNFIGELPPEMGNLRSLQDFMIDATGISGKVPTFIRQWTNLSRLYLQGTLMEGPLPSIFQGLQNLKELKVTDLKGGVSVPPMPDNMLQYLILRNCSISGPLPNIGRIKLKYIDLSFNNFTGEIPSTYTELDSSLNFMYLTNNMLNGTIPGWIFNSRQYIDVSYNSFVEHSTGRGCQSGNLNMIASSSSSESNSLTTCLRKGYPCSGSAKNYNLFINCGGKKVTIGGVDYEEDTYPQGTSTSFLSDNQNWAYSSTGDFANNKLYLATNASVLNISDDDVELYMSARRGPSLRYYGLCLQNGNYSVKLHFAEVMFTDDQTFSSVGRRFFDVSIQGKKVLTDFNIAKEANGIGQKIIKDFTAIVENNTLEIHFQWAGKGTTMIPSSGVYGPLISAISVTPFFKPDLGESKLSTGVVIGISVSSCILIVSIFLFLWFCIRRRFRDNNELKGLESQTFYFTLKQIKSATRNFDPVNKIGEGGFGPVYKGILSDGAEIAVKQLSSKSRQGNREFVNEVGLISALQHPNLVKLFGCCVEGNQLLLVYEYMENNSLARALFGPEDMRVELNWHSRRNICIGIARGLAHLHDESRLKIVHRDIKATNILLDKNLNAKISDFGLAKLNEEDISHISTRIAGTIGYMAPEYAMRGYLTDKADVYSFGIVMLEVITGKSNANYRPKEEIMYLVDWALLLKEKGDLLDLVDSRLGLDYSKEEAVRMLNLALLCTNASPTIRPSMSNVVSMLEGQMPIEIQPAKLPICEADELVPDSSENPSHGEQSSTVSTNAPWANSSTTQYTSSSISMNAPWAYSSTTQNTSSSENSTFHSSAARLL